MPQDAPRLIEAPLSRIALGQLAVAVVLLAAAWPVTKQAIGAGAAPMWFATGRAGLAAAMAFAVLGLLGRVRLPSRQDMPAMLAVGLLQIGGFFAFAHAAVAWVPAGRTAILSNMTTIWIVPLSVLVLRERIPARRWIAAGLGLVGVIVLMGPWAIDWTEWRVLVGHAFLLGAAGGFSIAMIVCRRHPPRMTMLELLPWCFLLGALMLLPMALAQGSPGAWPPMALASLAGIGMVAGPVGTWCIMESAAKLPSVVASVGFLMTPASGLLLSTWWLGEPLGPDLLAGSVLIFAGVMFAAWPARAK